MITTPGGGIPGFTHFNDGYYNDNYFYIFSRDLTFIGNWKHMELTSGGAYNYHLDYTADYSFETFLSVFLSSITVSSSTLDYSKDTTPSYTSWATIHSLSASAYIYGSRLSAEFVEIRRCINSSLYGTSWVDGSRRTFVELFNSTICRNKY